MVKHHRIPEVFHSGPSHQPTPALAGVAGSPQRDSLRASPWFRLRVSVVKPRYLRSLIHPRCQIRMTARQDLFASGAPSKTGIALGECLDSRLPGERMTRFAPAPTGALHLGHVVNAVYVWGLAGALGGRVLLRIEDHDRQRARRDVERRMLDDLDWLGFVADIIRRRHIGGARARVARASETRSIGTRWRRS